MDRRPVNTTIDISHRRSPLERLRCCFVGWKETLESKLREGHVNRRAEHRRRAEEAQFSGVGDELEGDKHARGFIAGWRHEWVQHVCCWEFRELCEEVDQHSISGLSDLGSQTHQADVRATR